jgi:acetoin utilization deacetylase AcuC-like enzyme
MILLYDPQCAEYGTTMRPEQPVRVIASAAYLQDMHPDWTWRRPALADEAVLRTVHAPEHLARLQQPPDFDDDTPYYPDIDDHARRSVGAALAVMELALAGKKAFALMRPPGHHATATQAMGFCYLNQIAIAAVVARSRGCERVAVWDFDAHHGNGTEAILQNREGFLYASVHQYPGYPGTGTSSTVAYRNWSVPPHAPREVHLDMLRRSFDAVVGFRPDLVLVSAGFDAYVHDPITSMSLELEDFATLGSWLHTSDLPVAAVLEGGYSPDLPRLIDAFLTAWA